MNTKSYRFKNFWKIFNSIVFLFILGGLVFLTIEILSKNPVISITAIVIVIALLFFGFIISCAILYTFRSEILISDDKIIVKGISSRVEYLVSDIRSFSREGDSIYLYFKNGDTESLSIGSYYTKSEDIWTWFESNYEDEKKILFVKEENDILNDDNYGLDVTERISRLKEYKMYAKWYNIVGGVVFLLSLFYPYPYDLIMAIAIIYPLIGVLIVLLTGGTIRINESKGKVYPSLIIGLYLSAGGIFIRCLLDFDIYDVFNTTIIILSVSILLTTIFLWIESYVIRDKMNWLTALFFLFLSVQYSYGLIVHINCNYDTSDPMETFSEIIEKKSTSGKRSSYDLYIDKDSFDGTTENFEVSKSFYDNLEVGDTIVINEMTGKFNLSWVFVTK